ncbi:MAG: 4-oxalomesaconate tautomerase [Pseudomonadota bacterium]
MKQTAIPYMQLRGGSSKGLYFLASDLPADPAARDEILLDAVGRDARQVDGLGGADPLTSKVAIVSLSEQDEADIDFLFVQVVVGENRVDTTPNCGNILAGVGAFAIETGLLTAASPTTNITVNMVNTGKLCELVMCTPNGEVEYEGDAQIDGVPGTAAPVVCNYLDVAGAVCGALFPTGNLLDTIDGVKITCVDNGMPVVVLRAEDFDISGYETPDELNANDTLKQRLESIRLQAGPLMNLGDVSAKAVPKMSLVSPATHGGLINTRTFIPHKCHAAVGVLGAVSVATACIVDDTVTQGMVAPPTGAEKQVSVEHPSGEFSVNLLVDESGELPTVEKAGVLRTTRLLSKGELYVPS